MKNIYDNREGLLNEQISPNAFDNKGIRLRCKISRVKKEFEDRLCSLLLNFSSRVNICAKTAKVLAEDRILKKGSSSYVQDFYSLIHIIRDTFWFSRSVELFFFSKTRITIVILSKQLREREFSDKDELKNMKFHHSYIHRVLSDNRIRQSHQFSSVKLNAFLKSSR